MTTDRSTTPANPKMRDAVALFQQARLTEAEAVCRALLAAEPGHFDAQHLLGVIALQLKAYDRAVEVIGAALAINAGNATAHNNQGLALMELKRFAEAAASFAKAVELKPEFASAHYNLGLAMLQLKRPEAALESCARSIALNPDFAEVYNARGLALKALGKIDAALAALDKAIALKPALADAWNNRGAVLGHGGRHEDALQSYDRAVALDPRFGNAWVNRGVCLVDLGRRTEALESFEKATTIDPENADAHWNKSLYQLQLGDFENGWHGHEWRWKGTELALTARTFPQPLWLGTESPRAKTVLLHADQGFGDTIQFSRYVKCLSDLGARVILEVRPPLKSLLATLEGLTAIVARGEALPAFDLHCPLGSLPLAFKTVADTIPAPTGYLAASPQKIAAWRAVLGERKKPRIGLAWSGNPHHANDRNRSIPLADLLAMLPAGIEYIALQKDMSEADAATIKAHAELGYFGDRVMDFSDTAALCALMDRVVSVDTGIAHLAGALARPISILLPFNPDWRWLLARSDSPWYASAKLVRQSRRGDWRDPLAAVAADLCRMR